MSFTTKEEPVENLRPIKVRVIGAGYSGIVNAIRWVSDMLQAIDIQLTR